MKLAETLRTRTRFGRGAWNLNGRAIVVVLAAIQCGHLHVAGAAEPGSDSVTAGRSLTASIDQVASLYADGHNFSGTILVAQGDEILINNGYGMSVYEHGVKNTGSTKYLIGSVSKSFTAAAILLLQEHGDLELDDSISRFLPGYPRGNEIKVEHLLDHTSGIPRIVFSSDFAERSQRHHSTQNLADWIQDMPLTGSPGENYSYSNANYALLALIIEKVSGISYSDFLITSIFERLSLVDTGNRSDNSTVIDNLASGYTPAGHVELWRSRYFDYSIFTGAGSLYSTTSDLFRWFQARQKGRLLSNGTRDRIRQSGQSPLDYGWSSEERLGRDALVMRGWDGVGFSAHFIHYLEEDVTVVVLGNLNMSSIASMIAEQVSAIVLGEKYDQDEILPKPSTDRQMLLEMEGQYRFGPDFYVPNTTIQFAVSDGQLIVPANESGPEGGLLAVSDNLFIHRQHWIPVTFEYSTNGEITGIVYGNFRATKERD